MGAINGILMGVYAVVVHTDGRRTDSDKKINIPFFSKEKSRYNYPACKVFVISLRTIGLKMSIFPYNLDTS